MRKVNIINIFLFLSILVFIATVILQIIYSDQVSKQIIRNSALNDAQRIGKALKVMRAKYTSEVVASAKDKGHMTITHDYKNPKYDTTGGAIPLPATLSMQIAEAMSDSVTKVKLYSNYPFPWRKDRKITDFEEKAFIHFEKNKESDEPYYVFDEETQVLNYAIPDKMTVVACVNCHNTHPQSPKTGWALGDVRGAISISMPLRSTSSAESNKGLYFIFVIIVTTVIILTTLQIRRRQLNKSIAELNVTMEMLEQGELPDEEVKVENNELSILSKGLNSVISRIKATSDFARRIGSGDFQTDFDLKNQKDVLGSSLKNMQKELKAAEEEKEKRNWATQGLAMFGEMMRSGNDDFKELSDKIIAGLVKYVNVSQGALYMISDQNQEGQYLEMIACYAYGKKKFVDTKILPGEGLVGQCMLEKEPIFITEVPANYIKITSGLGEALPRSLYVFPLKINEEVFGVIELASFKLIQEHEKEFILKVSESIAVTLRNTRLSIHTKILLDETRIKSEQLKEQEEEMRQNLEEMHQREAEAQQQIEKLKREIEKLKKP
jgi:hypothetical protein